MNRWVDSLRELKECGEPAMLVTVMDVRGSAPRECGAKMLVTAAEVIGSIGGGQLEYECTRIACEAIEGIRTASSGSAATCDRSGTFARRFPLGSTFGQCCGGVVEVLFEELTATNAAWVSDLLRFFDERAPVVMATTLDPDRQPQKFLVTADECRAYGTSSASYKACNPQSEGLAGVVQANARPMLAENTSAKLLRLKDPDCTLFLEPIASGGFNLAVFGAGHVGSAVIAVLAALDCNVRWIDSRRDIFPAKVPANVTCIETGNPVLEVAAMPPGSFYLVMTHSHPLDLEICSRILARRDFAYCGLIGSISKRRRFEKLMRKQGIPDSALERLTCPIGIAGIESKKPEAIAIAVAAEVLQNYAVATAADAKAQRNLHVL